MGDGDKKGSGASPAPLIIAALVVAVSIVAKRFELESWRPPQSERPAHYSQPLQTVPARLWQDPLAAIADLRGKSEAPPGVVILSEPTEIVGAFLGDGTKNEKKHVNVILVTVFGGPYAEYGEGRRRQRYAIATGLLESDYEPADAEKLGVLRHDFSAKPKDQLDIPFEWYTCRVREPKKCDEGAHVLVMWVNDDLLVSTPLAKLDSLYPKRGKDDKYRLTRSIVGPAGSGTLIGMLKEAARSRERYGDIRIFSPNATIDPQALLREARITPRDSRVKQVGPATPDVSPPGPWQHVQGAFAGRGLTFVSTVGTDDRMAATLARETTLRQYSVRCLADEGDSPPACLDTYKVLIVAEGDTEYARSLANSYTEALVKTQCEFSRPGDEKRWRYEQCRKKVEGRVFRMTYLRGLDGETARPPADGQDKDAKRGGNKADSRSLDYLELLRAGEPAAGNVQYDYLRRLGRNAKALERAAAVDKMAMFQAIAIFGSDAYDKLLVMQVLRSEFPGAYFLTTDMDARYLQREQLDWSRNLIVASSYGLQLNRHLRGHSGPFRDAYQSAQFMAARLAVTKGCDVTAQGFIDSKLVHPRLFEISTAGPVELRLPSARPPSAESLVWQAVQDGRAARLADFRPLLHGIPAPANVGCELFLQGGDPISSLHPEASMRWPWYTQAVTWGLLTVIALAAWYSLTVRRQLWHVGHRLMTRWPEIVIAFALVYWLYLPRGQFWTVATSAVVALIGCVISHRYWRGFRRARAEMQLFLMPVAMGCVLTALYLILHGSTDDGAHGLVAFLPLPLGMAAGLLMHPRRLARRPRYAALFGTVVGLMLLGLLWGTLNSEAEEPTGFLNGASSWLSEALRVGALIFNAWAIGRVFVTLRASQRDIELRFFPAQRSAPRPRRTKAEAAKKREAKGLKAWCRATGGVLFAGLVAAREWLLETRRWLVAEWKGKDFLKKGGPNAAALWDIYIGLCKPSRLLVRAIVGAGLFFIIFLVLILANPLTPPVRGAWSSVLDSALLIFSVLTFFVLIFLVVDVVRLTAKFVYYQSIGETEWPDDVLPKIRIAEMERVVRDTTDLELLSRRTEAVSRLVILPFVPLLLLVLARHEVVDAWAWTWPMVLLFTLCFAFLIVMAVQLRSAAEAGKAEVLTRLTKYRLKALGNKDDAAAGYLDSVIKTMERFATGAYSPVWQAEWLRGLAIPTTGYGALEIMRALGAL